MFISNPAKGSLRLSGPFEVQPAVTPFAKKFQPAFMGGVDMAADVVADGVEGGLHMGFDSGGGDPQFAGDPAIAEVLFAGEVPDFLLLRRGAVDGGSEQRAVAVAGMRVGFAGLGRASRCCGCPSRSRGPGGR